MFKLNNLKSPTGSNHAPKRKGRGIGSGNGKTAGKGHKGQRARSGRGVSATFEGGQMPLTRRSPKFGFRSPLKADIVFVNVSDLGAFAGKSLSLKEVIPSAFKGKARARVVLFGTRPAAKLPASIEVHRVAPAAKTALEGKGVKITVLEHKDGARVLPRNKKKAKA